MTKRRNNLRNSIYGRPSIEPLDTDTVSSKDFSDIFKNATSSLASAIFLPTSSFRSVINSAFRQYRERAHAHGGIFNFHDGGVVNSGSQPMIAGIPINTSMELLPGEIIAVPRTPIDPSREPATTITGRRTVQWGSLEGPEIQEVDPPREDPEFIGVDFSELETRVIASHVDTSRYSYEALSEEDDTLIQSMRDELLNMAADTLRERMERSMLFGEFDMPSSTNIPQDNVLALALAERVLQSRIKDNKVTVNRDVVRQSLRVEMELPYRDIVQAGNGQGVLDTIANVELHEQNAKTILRGLLKVIENAPDDMRVLGELKPELRELVNAAKSLLKQDLSDTPVDLPPEVQSIANDSVKTRNRTLKVRKKPD